VSRLGEVLFNQYTLAFEVTSILIIVAMVGAVVIARKREE
jgi:NADH:ubiquinone oxidoreductase subunit 6 (subunit J)